METGIVLRINSSKMKFTYIEEQIAEYFLKENEVRSIVELSKELNISPASITRFCKKIGLANYKELIYLYTDHMKNNKLERSNNVPIDFKNCYMKLFDDIDKIYDSNKLDRICEQIYAHRLIHIFALGLSATAGQDFKFRFSRIGKFIEVIYDKTAIKMTSSILQPGDLVFIFTLRGNKELEKICKNLKRIGVTVVTITANRKSTLKEDSDIFLATSNFQEEDTVGIMSAQIPILVQIDLIYYTYIKKYEEVIGKWIATEKVFN